MAAGGNPHVKELLGETAGLVHACAQAVVDAVEHARHRDQVGRSDLGQVGRDRQRPSGDAARLAASLVGLPELLPNAVALDAIGRFGPALLWIGPSAAPDWMRELSRAVRQRLDAAGIEFDRRPLHPHLTLVRNARDRTAADASTGPAKTAVVVARWQLIVGGSHPAPTPLRRYLWRRLPRPTDA